MEQFIPVLVGFFASITMFIVIIGLVAPDSFMEAGNGWLLFYGLVVIGYLTLVALGVPVYFQYF